MIDLCKPWLLLPPHLAHSLGVLYLKIRGHFSSPKIISWHSLSWKKLFFPNPLGISGGVDKNAENIKAWWSYGAGFIEVGTVTPKPQSANPGTILMRDTASFSLWNKMGFPNRGVDVLKKNLSLLPQPRPTPIFINIGKNRATENDQAVNDYLYCIRELIHLADAFVINISSPNTSGLRNLLNANSIKDFLIPLVRVCEKNECPILLKLSPDMANSEILNIVDQSLAAGINGWVLTNTTTQRFSFTKFPSEGGLSGLPLKNRSCEVLKIVHKHLSPEQRQDKIIVSSGGIMNKADVLERLELGADLIQVYSAIVFEGTGFFHKVGERIAYEKAHS